MTSSAPFDQVPEHRVGRALDDLALVVERADRDARAAARLDLVEPRQHAVDDLAAVRALEHDDGRRQRLARARPASPRRIAAATPIVTRATSRT